MYNTIQAVHQSASRSPRERLAHLADRRASTVFDGPPPARSFAELVAATPLQLKLEHVRVSLPARMPVLCSPLRNTQILPLLDPADLVSLTETSREYKDLLRAPSAQSVWRMARGRMGGMPARPDDLGEAQYADLLFGTGCHVRFGSDISWCAIAADRGGVFVQLCDSEKGAYTFWAVRVRMCYACLRIECVSS